MRLAIMAVAAARPTAAPSSLACPSGIAASDSICFPSRKACWPGNSHTSVSRAAVTTAASADAPGGALRPPRYGEYSRVIALTASNTATGGWQSWAGNDPIVLAHARALLTEVLAAGSALDENLQAKVQELLQKIPSGDKATFVQRDYIRAGTQRGPDSKLVLPPMVLKLQRPAH